MAFLKLFSQFSKRAPVVCLTGLLLLFTSSTQPVGACDCVKISSVKANMHTLQTMVETYFVDHKRVPASGRILEFQARHDPNPYWKNILNPFTSREGYLQAWGDYHLYNESLLADQYAEILGIRFMISDTGLPESTRGLALYLAVSKQKYLIYGVDQTGQWVIDKGKPFVLSNS